MVVDHADRLHEGVADCRSDELESALLHVLAHYIGFSRVIWNVGQSLPAISDRHAIDESPYVGVECAEFLARLQECLRIGDRSGDLQSVPHDACIVEQPS